MAAQKKKITLKVRKRDGRIVKFERERIETGIFKAAENVGGNDRKRAAEITDEVVRRIQEKYKGKKVIRTEAIAEIIKQTLIDMGHGKTSISFGLFVDLKNQIRNIKSLIDANTLVKEYIDNEDWQVNENSNMTYSWQGLNNFISSTVQANYWLHSIYPKDIANANIDKVIHIHDLGMLAVYCCGWSLEDLLLKGFTGVPGKISSSPAKHFTVALGQCVNFFYTLQHEAAGAQAFSSFDTYLAPFVRYDKLSYKEVKQRMQEFIYNMNVPTRVGCQCVSEDTQILTPDGWKGYKDISKGTVIKTYNLETGKIENQEATSVFKSEYKGVMYNLKNRIQDQLISPNHRVVRKMFNSDKYILEPIEKVLELKSPFIIPVSGENSNKTGKMTDEQIKLMAWVISEGSIEKEGSKRISIYQSKIKNPKKHREIIELLSHFKFTFTEAERTGFGKPVKNIRLDAKSSRAVMKWFGNETDIKFIPKGLLNLDGAQSRLFLDTYLKGDGFEGCKITTSNKEILNGLQVLAVNAGYGFTALERRPTIGKKDLFVLRLIKHKETYIKEVKKINYEGVIWCPHTVNETIIARRNGKVFITGNTPFTNITMDLVPSGTLAEQNVIIGGKPQKEKYKDFKKEMGMINKAFCEIMMEGDSQGRLFSYPIPTYNLTTDFDWDSPDYTPIWDMTAKYGIPYFSNFINSDMKPDDARSMCLDSKEEVLIRDAGNIKKRSIKDIVERYMDGNFDKDGWAQCKKGERLEALSLNPETGKTEWTKVTKFLKVSDDLSVKIIMQDGKEMVTSSGHLVPVLTKDGLINKLAKDVKKNDYLLSLKSSSELSSKYENLGNNLILDDNLAKILGYFVADGNFLKESRKNMQRYGQPRGLQFTFNAKTKEHLHEIKDLLNNHLKLDTKEKKDPRYNSYYLYVYNVDIAQTIYNAGFKKYGKLPDILFNSPKSVIENFLTFHYKGDGYEKRREIHINDKDLAKDLVMLYSLINKPVIYKERKNSQTIYIQHKRNKLNSNGFLSTPTLAERVPGFLAKSTYLVPGLNKSRMVGFNSLEKYSAQTLESKLIEKGDYYIVRVKDISLNKLKDFQDFFDLELEKNHLFVHSLGTITHNCCRLRIDNRELKKKGGGFFGANPLTGSIGVVTINLPRIGIETKTKEEYFNHLDRAMDLAKRSLVIKRTFIEKYMEKGLYPYSKFYLSDIKKRFGEYFKNHFNTIGILGMNESLINFFGDMEKGITSKEGREFALEIMDYMREKLKDYQKETNQLFNLEATPGEGATYKFAKADKKKFGDLAITAADIAEKKGMVPYYTNSSQLPVGLTDDIFEALDLQDEFQCKYTGGTVMHLYLGERVSSADATKNLVKKVAENYRLPYFSITPTFSVCPKHGYITGEHKYCPKCDIEVGYKDGMKFSEKF